MPYPVATRRRRGVLRRARLDLRRRRGRPRRPGPLDERCDEILEKRTPWRSTGPGRRARTRDQRDFRILQSSPTIFFPEIDDERFRAWAIEFASALMGRPVEFWYDQFLAKPPRNSAPRCGTRTRPTGAATSTTWASRAGCRCTTSTRATAACTSSTAATSTASSSTTGRPREERPAVLRARRVPRGRLPAPRRGRHLPPRQDPAHDHGQHAPTRGGASSPSTCGSRAPRARATTTRGRST